MDDQIVVWEMPDGTIRYATCPARMKKPGELKNEWLLRQFNKTVRENPKYAGAKRILNALMPGGQPFTPGAKKLFRDAWRHGGGGKIEIDMPEARKIRMGEIRVVRDRALLALDKKWLKATGEKDTALAAAIEAKRKALRDLPNNFAERGTLEAIATPEELANLVIDWPTL